MPSLVGPFLFARRIVKNWQKRIINREFEGFLKLRLNALLNVTNCVNSNRNNGVKYEPEHSKNNGEPDWNTVDNNAEAGVKLHASDCHVVVPLRVWLGLVEDVEMQGEWKIRQHRQPIGNSESRKDAVGCWFHILSRQHNDVQCIGHNSEEADNTSQIAMMNHVPILKV